MGQKILFVSGCIGLGHVTRDISIANELSKLNSSVEIVWMADLPASTYLREMGANVLPGLEHVSKGANDLCDEHAKDYALNLYPWWLAWYATFPERVKAMVEAADKENVDLIVGDETYDLYIEYVKHPKSKKRPFLLILDFVGGHLSDGIPKKKLPLWFFNKWTRDYLKQAYGKEGTLFIGEANDVIDEKLGMLLPSRRDVVKQYATCVGYSLNFDPRSIPSKQELRAKLGYGPEPLVIVTVGGTAAAAPLLRKAAEAYPIMKKAIPNLKMVIVAGPRVAREYVKRDNGLDVKGMVPNLYEHMAAADLTISAGGGTTTQELQALNKPFIYFPLEQHFEQQIDVAYHLKRDNIGVNMVFSKTTPEALAAAALENIGKTMNYPKLPTDGSRLAAKHISDLLGKIGRGEFKASG
jgi:UDP-N-acetylglucosamine:LPS N-acetylglucosamine transferase